MTPVENFAIKLIKIHLTKIGVEIKFKDCHYPVMIQPNKIPELNIIKKCTKGLIVGAAVTIDKLEKELMLLIKNMPGRLF